MVIDNLSGLGLTGDNLIVVYQALENFVIGSGLNDGLGVSDNWEIRRARYEVIGRDHFSEMTASRVADLSEAAYVHGVTVMLDVAERLASVNRH